MINAPLFSNDSPVTGTLAPAATLDEPSVTRTRSTFGTPVIHEHPASARTAAADARDRATRGPTVRRPPAGEGTKYRMLLRKLR
ncbi:hypothetical protein rosag_35470 [Roseisolibacter agri]|uniref:Uncharacterized protein n=1 Tax=Roseisolibacter agri TaxID=2014610 RepID=A0AA37Q5M9_9BACT|nr:hypothetical protein rosag_35470 [Roseisolibacter agri]